jgi:diphosphomevalonate decarboxylase
MIPAQKLLAQAPSNIALVKYMGKEDAALNIPANPSLSMTLSGLCSWVEFMPGSEALTLRSEPPEIPAGASLPLAKLSLNEAGAQRFLRHAKRVWDQAPAVLQRFGIESTGGAEPTGRLATANTFPASSGIASSASSFAALTLVLFAARSQDSELFDEKFTASSELRAQVAAVARQGSGSACRSFEGPFVQWDREAGASVETYLPEMADVVLLVSSESKRVSSSAAHTLVRSSPLWVGRQKRAYQRVRDAQAALAIGDLQALARLAWAEFWEMHSLFHTAGEPFSYMEPGTIEVVRWIEPLLTDEFPPIVTLDAGPNVHLLVPVAQVEEWKQVLAERFPAIRVVSDVQGRGAKLHLPGGRA